MRKIINILSSLGLSTSLLIMLGILTWLGTLEQVEHGLFDVQKKYFESFYLWHDVGSFSIPLPGANLVLSLLFVNVLVGGLVRLRKRTSMIGIMITHIGIAMLLLSGFVKLYYAEDGHVTLYEGQSSDTFQSYYRWEIVITEEVKGGDLREYIVRQEDFLDATGDEPVTMTSPTLPFDLELAHLMQNCSPMPKGPMFDVEVPVVDGFFLRERPKAAEAERNIAGLYAAALTPDGKRQDGILWGVMDAPWTVNTPQGRFAVDLRKERYPMPFAVVLNKFTKEDHPGMGMAKAFMSDVTVVENGSARPVRIEMNHPLRDGGLVLFQASWGPGNAKPGTPLFSTFSVVRNPADHWPRWSCWVIAAGLLIHFARKLWRYIRVEARKA